MSTTRELSSLLPTQLQFLSPEIEQTLASVSHLRIHKRHRPHYNVNSFESKKNFESQCGVDKVRSEHSRLPKKPQLITSVWEQKPVDFSWKLYHPHPPKRNSRDAIKPWLYDRFLRSRSGEPAADQAEPQVKQRVKNLMSEFLSCRRSDDFETDSQEREDFRAHFRLQTPNGARLEAAKIMGYRTTMDLGVYKIPKPHEFRDLFPPLFGEPDFQTIYEKDPYNLKFLSEHLHQMYDTEKKKKLSLRECDPGIQMGDLVKKEEPKYDPRLILPKLPFPNKSNGYTRFRRLDRSVESAFWDRALPKINQEWDMRQKTTTRHTLTI